MKKILILVAIFVLGFSFFMYLYIENIIKNYDKYFSTSLGGFDFDFDVASKAVNMLLGNSNSETFGITLLMKNSSIFLFRVSDVSVDVYYNDILVGNVTAENSAVPIVLTPYKTASVDLDVLAINNNSFQNMCSKLVLQQDTLIKYTVHCKIFGTPIVYTDTYTIKL